MRFDELGLVPELEGAEGERHRPYGVVINCANEAESQRVHAQLTGRGFDCRQMEV